MIIFIHHKMVAIQT